MKRVSASVPREGATRRIALVGAPGTEILDLVGPYQVFSRAAELVARRNPRAPIIYQVEVISGSTHTMLTTNCGLSIQGHQSFRRVRGAIDTLLIAGGHSIETDATGGELILWVERISRRVRRVGSVCTGALLLARAGLLHGRKATTHWKWCGQLAREFPRIEVVPDPIFVRDGNIYTSAGVTAGMDLALALVEEDHGSRLALEVARELVLYLRRPGGQSQFSATLSLQLSDRKPLADLASWILDNVARRLTVQTLAHQVSMSPRNFARAFVREMKITPAKYVERVRVEVARRRLEETRHSLKRIAGECGFGSFQAMHAAFRRELKVSPAEYRERFQGA